MKTEGYPRRSLYDPAFEHDACGIGAVVDIHGRPSHQTVDDALSIVEKLEHRAGKDAEGKTGDGVGILLQISHRFFSSVAQDIGISLPSPREYGVGMFFFPQDPGARRRAKRMFELLAAREGLTFLGWRQVPVCPDTLGRRVSPPACPLTGSSMWPGGCSSNPTTTPMWSLCPAAPLSTRECF